MCPACWFSGGMANSAERLRIARLRAGFTTAKEAAESLGFPVSTYICHENGTQGISAKRAISYARKYIRSTYSFSRLLWPKQMVRSAWLAEGSLRRLALSAGMAQTGWGADCPLLDQDDLKQS